MPENVWLGPLASLGAALCWAVGVCFYRYFDWGVPAYLLNLYKNFVAVVCISLVLILLRPVLGGDVGVWAILALSGFVGIAIGDTASFVVLKRFGAQISSTSFCLSMPLSAFVAAIFLGEMLTTTEMLGMTLTFVSVVAVMFLQRRSTIIPAPGTFKGKGWALFCVFLSPTCHAVGVALARKVLPQVDPFFGTLLRVLPAVVFLFVISLIKGEIRHFRVPGKAKPLVGLSIGAVFGSFLGIVTFSLGLQYAKAGIVTAISSSYPLFVIPIAHVFLKEPLTAANVVLTLTAVLGIVLMMFPSFGY